MTSASRLSATRITNSTRLTKPSRLRLKRSQARRLGERLPLPCKGGGGGVSGRRGAPSSGAVTSIEFDTRVYPDVTEVADQFGEQADQGKEVQRSEHHWVVPPDHALVAEEAQAVQREQRFDQQRAGEEGADEGAGKAGDDRD